MSSNIQSESAAEDANLLPQTSENGEVVNYVQPDAQKIIEETPLPVERSQQDESAAIMEATVDGFQPPRNGNDSKDEVVDASKEGNQDKELPVEVVDQANETDENVVKSDENQDPASETDQLVVEETPLPVERSQQDESAAKMEATVDGFQPPSNSNDSKDEVADASKENNQDKELPVEVVDQSNETDENVVKSDENRETDQLVVEETPDVTKEEHGEVEQEPVLVDEPPPVMEIEQMEGKGDEFLITEQPFEKSVEELSPPVPEFDALPEIVEPEPVPALPEHEDILAASVEEAKSEEKVTVDFDETTAILPPEVVSEVELADTTEILAETVIEEDVDHPCQEPVPQIPELDESSEAAIGEPEPNDELEKNDSETAPIINEPAEKKVKFDGILEPLSEEPASEVNNGVTAGFSASAFNFSLPVTMLDREPEDRLLKSLPLRMIPTIMIEEVLTEDDKLQERKKKEELEREREKQAKAAAGAEPVPQKASSPLRRFVFKNFGVFKESPEEQTPQTVSETDLMETSLEKEAKKRPNSAPFDEFCPTESPPPESPAVEAVFLDESNKTKQEESPNEHTAEPVTVEPPAEKEAEMEPVPNEKIEAEIETKTPDNPKPEQSLTDPPPSQVAASASATKTTELPPPPASENAPPRAKSNSKENGFSTRFSASSDDQPVNDDDDKDRWLKTTVRGASFMVDLRAILPYKKFLSFGGFTEKKEAIIILIAAYLPLPSDPNYNYIINHLFCYVTSAIDLLAPDDYVVVYFHCFRSSGDMPPLAFCNSCYGQLDFRLRKSAKAVYVVHSNAWVKTASAYLSAFKQFARRKLIYVQNLANLKALIPTDFIFFPKEVIDADKTASKHGFGLIS